MAEFAGVKVLIVERFDRAWMDGGQWIARLPQEDFCQALGYPPEKKYEKDGGPGMKACLKLLEGSADPEVDRLAFQLTQLAFWLIGATDGHAKNYSLFLQPGDVCATTKNGGPRVWQAMLGMIGQVEAALAAVESRLPQSFPARIWDAIRTRTRSQANLFAAGLSELDGL